MADYVSPDARRRIAGGLMAAQYNRATPEEGNVAQRHGLLPLATYDNGRTGLAFPGFVAEPLESWGRLMKNGYTPGDTQGVEDAFNVVGAAMMGGLAAPKPRNVVGSAGGDLKGAALGAIPDTQNMRLYRGEGTKADVTSGVDWSGGLGDAARGRWFTTSADEAKSYAGKDGLVHFVDVPPDRVKDLNNSTLFPGEHYVLPEDLLAAKKEYLYANGGRPGAATGAALGAPQSMNDPALAEILRKYGLDVPSRPASPQYRPGDA